MSELEINKPEDPYLFQKVCSPVDSPDNSQNMFQVSAQLEHVSVPNAFEYGAPEVNVSLNFTAFDNAGMLPTQDIQAEPGTESFFGLFAAVESLSNDVSEGFCGGSHPAPTKIAELDLTPAPAPPPPGGAFA